jgi:xanthine dehydrogenase accessory factor
MVSLPGARAGGVTGGCLEEYVARIGERDTRETPTVLLHFGTDSNADEYAPALGCGASVDLLVERLTAEHLALLEQYESARRRDECSLLVCTVRQTCGAIAVTRTWSSESAEYARVSSDVQSCCQAVMRQRISRHARLDSNTEALVHYVPPVTRLLVFGAGDDAQPICDLGASLGWHVTVADRRARLATRDRFPNAASVIAAEWDEAVNAMIFSRRSAVVFMTHSVEDDLRLLSLISQQPDVAYVGALGPLHRREWLCQEVITLGVPRSRACVANLRGPIGLALGDRSAAGIAVAVIAEILAVLNGQTAQSLSSAKMLNNLSMSGRRAHA